MRILLVEDEPTAARMLAKGLREHAYAVDVAADGETAIFQVGTTDSRIDLVRPIVHRVTGRLVGPKNVLPRVLIGFATDKSYVTATVSADGTFSADLQPARHIIELGGLPPAYSLGSARLGSQDVSKGLTVGAQDLSGLEIAVAQR